WTDTPGVNVHWEFGAAVYSSFTTNNALLNVKPVDSTKAPSSYANTDPAGTPEADKSYAKPGGTSRSSTNYNGTQSGDKAVLPDVNQVLINPLAVSFATAQAAGTSSAPMIVTITNNHLTWPMVIASLVATGDYTLVPDAGGAHPCNLAGPTPLSGQASC